MNIAVLASGRGSNFQAIIDGIESGEIDGKIRILITDNPQAKAIERAKKHNIHFQILERKDFKERIELDNKIKEVLDTNKIDLVVLAGYMRIIKSRELLEAYKNKIINIHPSLLPAFKGSTHAQKDAFEHGCKVSGVTIHYVTADVDGGPILYQEAVNIGGCKSADEVASRILKQENKAYKLVVAALSKNKKP